MATITRESIGLLNDKITVKVGEEDYLPTFEKSLKSYSKKVNLPGFRKGMVPAGLVRKMHGPAIFADEVIHSVERELTKYLQEEKLEIFAQPLTLSSDADKLDMNQPKEYGFDFEIGLKPAFEVTPLKPATELTRYDIIIDDKLVDEEVNRLQLKGGNMTEPETISCDDNVVNVLFDECDKEGNLIEGGIQKDNSLLLKYFSPAIREQLMGKKKDNVIIFKLADSFEGEQLEWVLQDLGLDKDDPEAVNKYFKLTITKVGLLEKKELTENFFKEVFPNQNITTEEAFRNKIREDLAAYYLQQSTNRLHNELFELLIHETPIELPKQFLLHWLQTGGEKPRTTEEVEKEYPQFDHQLRWTLISEKLIRENHLQVTPEELREHIKKQVLGYYGLTADAEGVEWIESYIDRLLQDEKYIDQTYRELITNRLLDWAVSQITVKEESLSLQDFLKLPNKHHHHHEHEHA
jgi:trigger factor